MKRNLFLFILLLIPFVSSANTLLLYKASEQGYGESILKRYIVPELKKINEEFTIADVESTSISFHDFHSIITCYYTSDMKNAIGYLHKLSDFLVTGGKLFIINSIGAIKDKGGTNNPTLLDLNAVYNFMGISYKFGWQRIKIDNIQADKDYLLESDPNYGKRGIEYYKIFSSLVHPILATQFGGKTYPLVVLGPNGGIALYNYIFDSKGNLVVDIGKIIVKIVIGDLHRQNRVLMVGVNEDITMAFKYALVPLDKSNSIDKYIDRYMAIILIDGKLPVDNNKLLNYISAGGILVIVSNGNERFDIKDVLIDKGIFPLPEGIRVPINSSVNLQKPYTNAGVLVRSEKGIPVVWSVNIGAGKLLYYPRELVRKYLRGLFLQCVLSSADLSIQSIVNSCTIFIDDFPLPSYGVKRKPIVKEFGQITDGEFYYNIWWKDIKEIGEEFGLKYTTALITSYNGRGTWPFDFSEFLTTDYPFLEIESIRENGYEMGLHGYNHQSPVKKNWSVDFLEDAYRALSKFVRSIRGKDYEPVSFVAPNNLIDETGLKALKTVFPSIKIVGTSYQGTDDFSEYRIIDGVVILPRTTCGYYPVGNLLDCSILSIMNWGTYQYFFHPDDLFSLDRNPKGKSWAEMKASLKEFLRTMKTCYPWISDHYAFKAADIFRYYFMEIPHYRRINDGVEVHLSCGSHLPRYFFFRSSNDISLKGGKILYKYPGNLYVIEMIKNGLYIKVIR